VRAAGRGPSGDGGRAALRRPGRGARTLADLLDRRVRIGLVPADRERAVPVAEQVLDEKL
jgi:glycerol-3-phosphate dehydrogenase